MASLERFARFRRIVLADPALERRLRSISEWPSFVEEAVGAAEPAALVHAALVLAALVLAALDPTGGRKAALDAFLEARLREGFEIETHTDTHAIVVERDQGKSFLSRFRASGAAKRYVVSVDEHGEVTMIPAEPKRS